MSANETRAIRILTAAFGLALLLSLTPAAFGQSAAPTERNRAINTRPVPVGAKVKFRGVVVRRDADTFIIRDASRNDTQVLLTDDTSIKSKGGFLRGGKRYAVTDILTGLIVEVEGRGDREHRGQRRERRPAAQTRARVPEGDSWTGTKNGC